MTVKTLPITPRPPPRTTNLPADPHQASQSPNKLRPHHFNGKVAALSSVDLCVSAGGGGSLLFLAAQLNAVIGDN